MDASARIVAQLDRGVTRLAVLRGEAPLLPRRTVSSGPGVEVHLVGGAAGPLGGDRLHLSVEVGPGASLVLRTVAATLVLPGPGPSRLTVEARVEGTLHFLPEPVVAAAGSDHEIESTVDVCPGGSLVWRDELVGGRHGEPSGRLRQRTTVRYAGAPLLTQSLTLGAPDSPAVLAGATCVGNLLLAGDHVSGDSAAPIGAVESPHQRSWGARMALVGPGVLCTAVAGDAVALRRALETLSGPVP